MIVDHAVEGPVDAPALVLSTSIGTTRAMWEAQAAALRSELRVIRYDHRGHGGSGVPPGPYTLDQLGGDVVALLDHVGVERASFCGISLGGMVGMWLAQHAADRIDRLVLCCTAARIDGAMWAERAAAVRAAGTLDVLADATIERWLTPQFRTRRPDVADQLRAMFVAQPAEGYAACGEAMASMEIESGLGRIAAPTVVVAGAQDPSTPPAVGRRIADAIPGAGFHVLDGAHLVSVEQGSCVTALIRAHVRV